jgi:hypothetical protein
LALKRPVIAALYALIHTVRCSAGDIINTYRTGLANQQKTRRAPSKLYLLKQPKFVIPSAMKDERQWAFDDLLDQLQDDELQVLYVSLATVSDTELKDEKLAALSRTMSEIARSEN